MFSTGLGRMRGWSAAWASAAALVGIFGCGGDDGMASESSESSGASESSAGTDATSTATSTASSDGSASATTETTGPAPIDCGLNGAADQHYFTGTFTLTQSEAPKDATPTGVFDPLLGVEVCFGLTFTPSAPTDEPMAQRRFIVQDVVIKTDDTTGVAAATFEPADQGGIYLRLAEFSPYALILSVGAASSMGSYSFEISCFTPTPFENDDVGLPIFQSMVCEGGAAALRRFEGASSVTDIASGGSRFALHVP
ncbi:MAG: hypothetical protein R3B09_12980 [Nannocystaceae bacterium]